MDPVDIDSPFPTAREDEAQARALAVSRQTAAPSYRLAFADDEFLQREELRAVRLQLELLKPELLMQDHGVSATVVVFGSSRIPEPATVRHRRSKHGDESSRAALARKSGFYQMARDFAQRAAADLHPSGDPYVVITGGGGGIMEAANRGAADVNAKTAGLNIVLPMEQLPNAYITPELCFQFHYFAIRKLHFLLRATALAIFPGGFGTLDELFEALTLIQTGKMQRIPIVLFGRDYWQRIIDFDAMVAEGVVDEADLALIDYAESAEEGWCIIRDFHRRTAVA
jgi:uncharacterized protein (TIGR00730 family)